MGIPKEKKQVFPGDVTNSSTSEERAAIMGFKKEVGVALPKKKEGLQQIYIEGGVKASRLLRSRTMGPTQESTPSNTEERGRAVDRGATDSCGRTHRYRETEPIRLPKNRESAGGGG